jgi:hypothetical protein
VPLTVWRRWVELAACLASTAALGLAAAPSALALDEAQLSEITCHGFRVTQVGLPADTEFELVVLDPAAGRVLREIDVDTDGEGRLDVRVRVSLRGLPRVDVEVEKDGDEYAETGAELHLPCSPKAPAPTPVAVDSPPSADVGDDGDDRALLLAAGAVGAAGVILVGVLLTRWRRRSAGSS